MSESPLQMEQRHIVEGEARVASQRILLAALERNGNAETLANGRELLGLLCDTLALSRERLGHLQADQAK